MTVTIESIKLAKDRAKETGNPVKLSIGHGLRLNISKSSAVFQLRYRMKEAGKLKERTLTLGKIKSRTNPNLSKEITKALAEAEQAKDLVKQGIDPSINKKIEKSNNTESQKLTTDKFFKSWIKGVAIAAQWSVKHNKDMETKYNKYISPSIGKLPLKLITRKQIANLLEELVQKPATYKKVRSLLNMIFEDTTTTEKTAFNPTPRKTVKAAEKYIPRKLPALTSLPQLQNLLIAINRINIKPEVREAAILQAHTALRSQTVVAAKWEEFDLTNNLWRIPRVKGRIKLSDSAKYGDFYTVPLSEEIASQLTNWRNTLRWQSSEYLFPSNAALGYITIDSLRKVYKVRLKLDTHCAHGWRTSFSTIAHEAVDQNGKALFRTDVIERCLDHVVGNEVTQAYNRGELLELRKHLMYWWSKQLNSSNVVELEDSKAI